MRLNVQLELLEIAALQRDEVGFERWRRAVERKVQDSPVARAEYELTLGDGFSRFGKLRQAREHIQLAVQLAEQHGLHRVSFAAEAKLLEIERGSRTAPVKDFGTDAAVDSVAGQLRELRLSV